MTDFYLARTTARGYRWFLTLLLAIGLMATGSPCRATTAELALDAETAQPLKPWLEYFDPGAQVFTADSIASVPARQWRPADDISRLAILVGKRTLWYRLHVHTAPGLSNDNARWFISCDNPVLGQLQVFLQSGPQEDLQPTEHYSAHASSFFLPAGTPATLYIQATGLHSPSTAFMLQARDIFHRELFNAQLLAGLIDGLILGLVIYNALLYYKTRQRVYATYIGLGVANLITIITHQNVLEFLLPGEGENWTLKLALTMPLFVSAMLPLFIRDYLAGHIEHPTCNLVIRIYLWSMTAIGLAVFVNTPLVLTLLPYVLMSSLALIAMIYLCVLALRAGDNTIWLVLVSLMMPALSGLLTGVVASGSLAIAHNYVTLMQCSDVVEMILLSLAMAARIRLYSAAHEARLRQVAEEKIINSAHNRLLAHINHEIRTPLNGILGAAELLQANAGGRDRNLIGMIYNTGKSLQHLIDGMIDIRAISENRKALSQEPFALNQLLRECLDLFLPAARQKDIRLWFCLAPDVPAVVEGDPYRLRQILINLLGNAFKFTESGDIGIEVRMDGPHCHFSVIDSGVGIAEEDAGRLFDSFEQGDNSLGRAQAGSGLGLSIVRELSQLMGGSAGYSDNRALAVPPCHGGDQLPHDTRGSTFWFSARLPAHDRANQQATVLSLSPLQGRSLLIADSCCRVTRSLCVTLQAVTPEIHCACDPATLIAALAQPGLDAAVIHISLYQRLTAQGNAIPEKLPVFIYRDQHDDSRSLVLARHQHSLLRPPSAGDFLQQLASHFSQVDPRTRPQPDDDVSVGMHVLVAEDNPTSQLVIRGILQSLGISCDICHNGHEAEQRFTQQALFSTPYNAVLMDCEMPVQDGFVTAVAIRRFEKTQHLPHTPIIAVTAHSEPEYRYRSHQCGMDAYITKPINVEAIRDALFSLAAPSQG